MQRRIRTTLVWVALTLATCTPALAQVGALSVRVINAKDDTPMAGATVTLSSDQGDVAPTSKVADPDGEVLFPVLRAGSGYIVEVSMPGFATQRLTGQRVRTDVTERLDLRLSRALEERVEVIAHSDVVDLEGVGAVSRFDSEFLDELPVQGRLYQNVLSLAPGVNDWDGDGNPNVHGARTREFRGLVGGVANTDPLTGEWLSYVNPDSIEELQILTSGAGVEFGRASGGFANVVQRQGSNDFEGRFNLLYRSSKLDGTGSSGVGAQVIPEYQWIQPAILLTGPIIRDRLWYRLSHEYGEGEEPLLLLDWTVMEHQRRHNIADQITWQVSPRNKVAFQFQADPITIENYTRRKTDSDWFESYKALPESTQTLRRGGPTYTITWTAPWSASVLVESLVAYQDHHNDLIPTTQGVPQNCAFFWLVDSLNYSRCLDLNDQVVEGSSNETSRDRRQRLTLRSSATVHAGHWLGMQHRFKFGFIIENERYYRELDRGPSMEFFQTYNPFGPDYGLATVDVSAPRKARGRATGVSWALYGEDQVRPLKNLTLTLGLRFDREEIDSIGHVPVDAQGEADLFYQALSNAQLPPDAIIRQSFTGYEDVSAFERDVADVLQVGSTLIPLGTVAQQSTFWVKHRLEGNIGIRNNNVSPRLTAAWDPWSNGKTKLSANWGRYYDKIFLAVPLLEVEPPSTTILFSTTPFCAGCVQNAYRPDEGIGATVSTQMVDRDLRTPYQDEFTLGFERELWRETSIRLSYIKRNYRDQLQDVDINHRAGDEGVCWRQRPYVKASPGSGQQVYDPFTGETYVDNDPGPGDGHIDDCMGERHLVQFGVYRDTPDGKPDQYVLNPGWGEILLVGNFNTTDYEAFVLELTRRQFRNWQMNASYTWSKTIGDAEDFDVAQGNERNLLEDERGYLSHDQRHVVEVSAMTITPWDVRLAGTLRWASGLPYSILDTRLTAFSIPLDYGGFGDPDMKPRLRYTTGQRNDHRNVSRWNLDLGLHRDFRLGEDVNLQVRADVFNVFDDTTLLLKDLSNGTITGTRPVGRHYQLGMNLTF